MNLARQLCVVCGLVLALAGCDGKSEESADSDETAASAHAAQEVAKPIAAPTAEQLPVPEDFQQGAQDDITASNYEAALDALEKEINAGE